MCLDFNSSHCMRVCVRTFARGTNLIYDSTILMKKRLDPASAHHGSRKECDMYSVQCSTLSVHLFSSQCISVCAAVEYSIIVGAIRSLKHCIVNDGAVQELRME